MFPEEGELEAILLREGGKIVMKNRRLMKTRVLFVLFTIASLKPK